MKIESFVMGFFVGMVTVIVAMPWIVEYVIKGPL